MNSGSPVVSVLIPSFNSGLYIGDAVSSALAQRGVKVEVLVQDGGSTDGSAKVLDSFRDHRLKVAVERDAGQSDALNLALRRATGEFVLWLNADDRVICGAVLALVRAAHARGLDAVHGNYETIAADGEHIKTYTSGPLERARLIRYGLYVFSGAILVRRDVLIDLGGFNSDLHYVMDLDLALRLAESSYRKGQIGEIVAQFRRQPASKSESSWVPFLREALMVRRRHGATRLDNARRVATFTAYHLLKPFWRSRPWLAIRPRKHLGGRRLPPE